MTEAGRNTILVVDDTKANIDVLVAILSDEYKLGVAMDGAAALRYVWAKQPDLILLDIMMPGMDGYEVAAQIRSNPKTCDIPIMMVTALDGKEDRLRAVRAGANDFIAKPIDQVELRVRMQSLLKMKEAQDAIKRHRAELETEVERRTAALRASEERMRLLIESSPIGIVYAQHGQYSYVNPAVVKMLGYDCAEQIVGLPLEVLCVPGDREWFRKRMNTVEIGTETAETYEIKAVRTDGEPVDLSVWLIGVEYSGEPAVLGFLVDITEEKALKARILQAQKLEALGTLAAGIAHDFNNILFAITGFTEIAQDKLPEDSNINKDLDSVLMAADRATGLVKQILTFCREDQQEKEPIDLRPIVKETLKLVEASAPPTIELRCSVSGYPGTVMADPTQIHQVVLNLCTNAVHSMAGSGGTLSVWLGPVEAVSPPLQMDPGLNPGPYLKLSVNDTGHGMSPDVVQRIFEPYFTTKKRGEGTGLGLALVHGIVESHGGAITVTSERDRGTTFDVYLPIIAGAQTLDDSTEEEAPKGNERILLVDDEEHLAEMVSGMLASLGYQVVAKNTPIEALHLFRDDPQKFDLVITNVNMPDMSGTDLAGEMLALRNDIPVVLCTGFAQGLTDELALALGVEALIMKPILKNKLARTLRQALGARAGKES